MANELVKSEQLIVYTDDQKKLIKSQIAPKATDDELKLFLYQCQRTGLDPLTRQIYAIHRWSNGGEKMTIQTSIDGFRVIAERSGVYAGQSEPEFLEDNGGVKSCKVRVFKFRDNVRYEAAVGVAYWSEYVQVGKDGKPMGLWAKMPHTMLSKVSEALALRKAFPQDLSALYTADEMQQADAGEVVETKIPIKEAKVRAEETKIAIKDLLDCQSVADLKKLKEQLPDYVIRNESFCDAAKQRFNEISQPVDEPEVV